eukprot:TRINITY_DN1666_c0_g1_i3.p1 TRINITY_DN1666_c0_g1~~TRINITY_DN1666_c0_g1_i3.p1  ORF type:complete len:403 (+),score=74.74 TRINITY_DN1666_c0_g1_i3:72-1280(+)
MFGSKLLRNLASGLTAGALLTSGVALSNSESGKPRIFSWGRNSFGQLGIGNETSVAAPVEIPGFESFNVTKIAAGGHVSAAVTDEGILFTWGQGKEFNLGHGSNSNGSSPSVVDSFLHQSVAVESVSVSPVHSAVVSSAGQLFVWGNGYNGRLGFGDQLSKKMPEALSVNGKVSYVSCGKDLTSFITEDGEAYFSGGVRKGRPGMTQDSFQNHPVLIEVFDLKKNKQHIKSLSCGDSHIVMFTKSGDVYSLGNNEFGQLGTGRVDAGMKYEPVPVFALRGKNVVQVSCGSYHSAAITASGELYTWGRGAHGQLGHGATADQSHPTLVETLKDKKIVRVSCGSNHTAVVTDKGELYTFGKGVDGQLGHGDIGNRSSPLPVKGLKDHKVVDVACGYDHTVVMVK